MSAAFDTDLDVALDRPLPATIPVGRASAVFCAGTCFHRNRRIVDVAITLNGKRHQSTAQRMPRLDRFRELRSYRSGFWATIALPPRERPGELVLRLEARLDDGETATTELGTPNFRAA